MSGAYGSLPLALALLLIGSVALAWQGPSAEETGRPPPQARNSNEVLRTGELLFRVHCQNCHGPKGLGDGEMANLLSVRPTDLTRLEARNKGVFPAQETAAAIDGRTKVGPHGSPVMPVWGLSFQEPGRVGDQERDVAHHIESLVRYLESIQQ